MVCRLRQERGSFALYHGVVIKFKKLKLRAGCGLKVTDVVFSTRRLSRSGYYQPHDLGTPVIYSMDLSSNLIGNHREGHQRKYSRQSDNGRSESNASSGTEAIPHPRWSADKAYAARKQYVTHVPCGQSVRTRGYRARRSRLHVETICGSGGFPINLKFIPTSTPESLQRPHLHNPGRSAVIIGTFLHTKPW
ncbi:hypothetical protein K491DRAFT_676120 [Lophiostoma macrostomum CBS 122681]|uniref:Uncharacterized protein n=1 Tax=Lophiostoma macrostomum CBS 122681 TaxID=1314788 RepID=A0A6A6TFJ6_9PLEO|nr:hypothetical protein K491DRAFT_676120 [Lophiostoma macrostomum CBS 122681]